jgi:hypothetical protein
MKNLLKNAATGLMGILASAIITAWITGQPLTGLTKIKGLYRTFIQSSVPAWAFALVLLVALTGIYYALTHLPKRRPKGKIHFIPDAHNCGWSKQTDTEMNLRISGTFTYDGQGELIVLKAYLKGTQPTTDMAAQELTDYGGTTSVKNKLWLRSNIDLQVYMNLRLKPVVGNAGKSLRRKLIFLDKFSRPFPIGPIDFPYVGPKV